MVRHCISPGEDRPHTVYRYTDQIYKVIQWNSLIQHFGPGPAEQQKHYDKKLDASISRTKRVILEKALCNPWEWFCTFTIAESKYNRKDLIAWRDSFTQWMRDQRKKGFLIQYLIVPEQHKDGSWHAHGLFSGLTEENLILFREMDKQGYRTPEGHRLPRKLIKSEYGMILTEIAGYMNICADASVYVLSFCLFVVVVLLCYFAYKFLRIFF